jgi:hypothetical protein
MHRPGAHPDNMDAADFVCDFCGQCWREDLPMMEGHRGSLICGRCLASAYGQVMVRNAGIVVPEHVECTMCLMNKTGDYWQSPAKAIPIFHPAGERGDIDILPEPGACICRWCIERSAGMLEKDPAASWQKPT